MEKWAEFQPASLQIAQSTRSCSLGQCKWGIKRTYYLGDQDFFLLLCSGLLVIQMHLDQKKPQETQGTNKQLKCLEFLPFFTPKTIFWPHFHSKKEWNWLPSKLPLPTNQFKDQQQHAKKALAKKQSSIFCLNQRDCTELIC